MNPENNQNQQNPASNQASTSNQTSTPPQNQVALPPKHNALMAAIAYIGPLVIISYITSKDDSFVKFHIKQGLVLFVIEIAVWFVGMIIWMLFPFLQIINFACLVLAIIGIINSVKGVEKNLPLVGKFAENFKI